MAQEGTVEQWNDERGFGFIRAATDQPVFFHVRDFRASMGVRPRVGLAVRFELIHVGGKGPRAMAVTPAVVPQPAARRPQASPPARRSSSESAPSEEAASIAIAWALMASWLAMLVWGWLQGRLPGWVFATVALLNLATFWIYWNDKFAATRGAWRTEEKTLHLLSLAGGWPGAWWAQRLLRHKVVKASFQRVYRATVVLHCAAVGAWVFGLVGRLPR